MRLSDFYIERPIFASVLSVIIVLIGGLSYFALPISQYPEIAPPTIQVVANYPGASAEDIAKTVATPIEQEVNGVEGMLYMTSQSTNDGQMQLSVVFKPGTDIDLAQVLVQNRVSIAEPRLPEEVRRLGVNTSKSSPNLMMVINLLSPNNTYDQNFIANYATLQVIDRIKRIQGVGDIRVFGGAAYAMRIWLNPARMASMNLTANEVVTALRNQNIQVASGTLNQQPTDSQQAFEVRVQTQGRLQLPQQFADVIVKTSPGGRVVHLRDIARVEIGAQNYVTRGYLSGKPAVALPIFQRPGTNALETAEKISAEIKSLSKNFPQGLEYRIIYNPTDFVAQSIHSVFMTILEAIVLVIIVIFVFLQSWRVALIPILAIPISLVGTLAFLSLIGFSINTISLFGMVLAIGIVVDDAIVVVENMERRLREGKTPLAAAHASMKEVGSALIAMSLVLVAVFIPTMFVGGISGMFYRQFGFTVAIATIISLFVSLTLSPAIAGRLLVAHTSSSSESKHRSLFAMLASTFNNGLRWVSTQYSRLIRITVKHTIIMSFIYVCLLGLIVIAYIRVPTGFIPAQDQGYFIVGIQLPPGAALSRTDVVVQTALKKLVAIKGVTNAVGFSGFSGATFTNATNAAAIFPVLAPFEERVKSGRTYQVILSEMQQAMSTIDKAMVIVIPPPSVRGVGSGGGFKMMLQDRAGMGTDQLNILLWKIIFAANSAPETTRVFSFFDNNTPKLFLSVDKIRAEKLGVPIQRIHSALEVYLGSVFVNDFNYLGRTFRVTAQADAAYRLNERDIDEIKVRGEHGEMIPLGSVATMQSRAGPSRVPRYNLYPAIEIIGDTAPGYSSGEALAAMERIANKILPPGTGFEWTELALQQKQVGNTATIAFILAVIFVFLLLAAQYESLVLPLAIILIVPMCLLSAFAGLWITGLDNNILTQIGLIVLVALASKNAILIVEFAKTLQEQGYSPHRAAREAAKLRLRPILMTSFAFILGVVPLVLASGAGAEMRHALGVTVFSGMIGVTFFGLIFTPLFYVICAKLRREKSASQRSPSP